MFGHTQTQFNFNAKTQAILDMLEEEGFELGYEKDGAAKKKHPVPGVVICFEDNATQYVCPVYNDLEFELCPIVIRGGKLVVQMKGIAPASSKGLQWQETHADTYKGSLYAVGSAEALANLVYTPPPVPEVIIQAHVKQTVVIDEVDVVAAPPGPGSKSTDPNHQHP